MKLNIGCGLNKVQGFINIDKYPESKPDQVMDAERTPWPFDANQIDEVLFNHSLEHMGADTEVFLNLMKELYRVCKPGATIQINVPHPRHDNFLGDPTHVRIISPQVLSLFSKKLNHELAAQGLPNTPLGIYLDVDFEIKHVKQMLEEEYLLQFQQKKISERELVKMISERNNIVTEYQIKLEAIK
jgi:ubiquinone/menaquinone biosynthesis C-methylase UbiE